MRLHASQSHPSDLSDTAVPFTSVILVSSPMQEIVCWVVHQFFLCCRSELFSTLIRQPVEFFDAAEVGVLTSRMGADCQAVVRCLSTNFNVALRNGLQCIGEIPLLC